MLFGTEPPFPSNKNSVGDVEKIHEKQPEENPEELLNGSKSSAAKLERELKNLQKEREKYGHSIRVQEERLRKLADVKAEMVENFNSHNAAIMPQNLREEINKVEKEIREKISGLRGQESKLNSRVMPLEIEIEARKKGAEKKEKEQIFLEKIRKI